MQEDRCVSSSWTWVDVFGEVLMLVYVPWDNQKYVYKINI